MSLEKKALDNYGPVSQALLLAYHGLLAEKQERCNEGLQPHLHIKLTIPFKHKTFALGKAVRENPGCEMDLIRRLGARVKQIYNTACADLAIEYKQCLTPGGGLF